MIIQPTFLLSLLISSSWETIHLNQPEPPSSYAEDLRLAKDRRASTENTGEHRGDFDTWNLTIQQRITSPYTSNDLLRRKGFETLNLFSGGFYQRFQTPSHWDNPYGKLPILLSLKIQLNRYDWRILDVWGWISFP